jgi:cystathionine beta-lyase family protein involved in aluminum resistance
MTAIKQLVKETETTLRPYFDSIEAIALTNQEKVLDAFHAVKVTESDLQGTTGYGYDDFGRDHLEEILCTYF